MTIRIFAVGRRSTPETDPVGGWYYNECLLPSTCDWAPYTQALARILATQWVKVQDGLPPKTAPVLYLENADGERSGIMHYGYYNWHQQTFIEQGSGKTTPPDVVSAWLLIPKVLADMLGEVRRKPAHAYLD